MLKGDVSATPLSDVLRALAAQSLTGCLHIDDDAGDEALVYVKEGRVYAAYVPGRRPQLGARLISSGALAPEALAEALEAQETELQGWRLGELLVHLGYVDRAVVEAFVLEQLREAAFDLSRWPSGRYRFRKNEKTRGDVGMDAAVEDLLAEVDRRRDEWEVIGGVVHGPGAVPVLSAGGIANAEMTLDQDQWALLCKVDGERTIAQLARDCGFTTFEAGQIVYALVGAGLLDVEETVFDAEAPVVREDDEAPAEVEVDADFAPLGAALASVFAAPSESEMAEEEPEVAESEISRLLAGDSSTEPEVADEAEAEPVAEAEPEPEPVAEVEPEAEPVAEEPSGDPLTDGLASLTAALADLPSLSLATPLEPEPVAAPETEDVVEAPVAAEPDAADPFGDSLARVSEALSALLGDALPTVAMPEAPKEPEPSPEELAAAKAEEERLERMRAAAAAELAEAHALAEASRQQKQGLRFGRRRSAEREEAERRAAEEAATRAEAERLAAEEAERAEEAEPAEAERRAAEEAARLEAERLAAEEAERLAAEEAERAAEAERAEAERLEAERVETERIEAEEAERAAQEEADRRAAEEAARAEIDRLAAEETALVEAERIEAERAEAERLEAERIEAERAEAERIEAERAEAERIEAERVEAERAEAERLEAERVAAEEAERADAELATPPAESMAAFEVASFLRDFNDEAPAETVETVEEFVAADPEPERAAEPEPALANGGRPVYSETAALLRELTSLGLDDDDNNNGNGQAPAASRPAQPKEQPKKRKGLFGRG